MVAAFSFEIQQYSNLFSDLEPKIPQLKMFVEPI